MPWTSSSVNKLRLRGSLQPHPVVKAFTIGWDNTAILHHQSVLFFATGKGRDANAEGHGACAWRDAGQLSSINAARNTENAARNTARKHPIKSKATTPISMCATCAALLVHSITILWHVAARMALDNAGPNLVLVVDVVLHLDHVTLT
jgi:hypothetical protein